MNDLTKMLGSGLAISVVALTTAFAEPAAAKEQDAFWIGVNAISGSDLEAEPATSKEDDICDLIETGIVAANELIEQAPDETERKSLQEDLGYFQAQSVLHQCNM